jgi:hypothetical protein
MSTALAAYDVLCDPPVQPAAVARTEDGSSTELEDGFHPQMPEEEVGHQPTRGQAPARLALLPSKDDEDP